MKQFIMKWRQPSFLATEWCIILNLFMQVNLWPSILFFFFCLFAVIAIFLYVAPSHLQHLSAQIIIAIIVAIVVFLCNYCDK